ncbi:MAG TPA: hypothetical protein VMN78_02285 [Longimicrobiales bacterium]|nr:hypothetical protein [Longimicrobiales bacterium]
MHHIVFFGLLAAVSVAFALLEIQIEGGHGWASGLPTWRIRNRWTERFLGARAITGYHLYAHVFVLLLVHLPYAVVPDAWDWRVELRILAFLILFWILEDFLWFVLNPRYRLRRFRPQYVWWHAASWWGPMPRDYWLFIPVGIVLYLVAW